MVCRKRKPHFCVISRWVDHITCLHGKEVLLDMVNSFL